jgi:hypothetical protein
MRILFFLLSFACFVGVLNASKGYGKSVCPEDHHSSETIINPENTGNRSCLSVVYYPNAVSCGTTSLTAQVNCNFSGVVQMYIVNNPGNVIIPSGDVVVNNGVFHFDVTVEENAPSFVNIITTVTSIWSDPENCVLDEVCEPSTLVTSCNIPENDFCEDALDIVVTPNNCQYEIYSNNLWSSSGMTGNCSNESDNDLFFRFEAISEEAHLLFGELPSNSMTVELYDNCDASSIYCITMGSYTNILLEDLTTGNEYYLRITDLPGDNEGHIEMCLWSTFVCDLSISASVVQNEQCPGECNGIGNVIPSGGTGPYSYEWSNNSINMMAFNLCPGMHSVEVTDANGCAQVETIEIFSGTAAHADAGPDIQACEGVPFSLQASGGQEYLWTPSTGMNDTTISNPLVTLDESMSYSVLVTNEFGCQDIDTLNVYVHANPQPEIVGDSVTCNVDSLILDAGKDYEDFYWNTGDTNRFAVIYESGTYSVLVSDTTGCTGSDTFALQILPALQLDKTIIHESGAGFNNGHISVELGGGLPPYQYLWNTGDTTSSISDLIPGPYTLSVEDSFGCSFFDTIIIESYICSEITLMADYSPFICYDQCAGNIFISDIQGTTGPVQLDWNNGANTDSLNNLCEGLYLLSLTDSLNCSIQDSFIIGQYDEIEIVIDEIRHFKPSQSGAIKLDLDGNYLVEWTGPNNFTGNTENIFGLLPGCYDLVVTDTLSFCTADTTICIQDLTTAVQAEVNNKQAFIVYPNPAKDFLEIVWHELPDEPAAIQLVSMDGGIQMSAAKAPGEKSTKILLDILPNGVYLIKVATRNKTFTQKIMVAR